MTNAELVAMVDEAKHGNDDALAFLGQKVCEGWHLHNADEYSCFLFALWKAIITFDKNQGEFLHYARVVASHELRSYRCRQESYTEYPVDISEYDWIMTQTPSVEDMVVIHELLKECFRILETEETVVIFGRYYLGWTHQEVSDFLHISVRRSKYLQKLAFNKLRNRLRELV